MNRGLQDRVVVVTESASGIGRSAAVAFGREGARVAVTYRQHREQAQATARTVVEAGRQSMVVQYDFASEGSIATAIKTVANGWGSKLKKR